MNGKRGASLLLPWLLVAATVAATSALPADAAQGYAVGRCLTAKPSFPAEVMPTFTAGDYLVNYRGQDPRYKEKLSKGEFFSGAKVTLVKAPKHGKVTYSDDPLAVSRSWYKFTPTEHYVGKDRFVMQVEKDGLKVTIHYVIEVLEDWQADKGYCEPGIWKISGNNRANNRGQTTFS